MPAAEPPVVSSESGLVKMEDRKRPAADNNDSAPPLKKQATTVNGGTKPHPDADMPWKDDLEVCGKPNSVLSKPSRVLLTSVLELALITLS